MKNDDSLNEDFLGSILDTLMKKNKKKDTQENQADIKTMHQTIDGIISDYDHEIKECKKYNEARIHRKYQIALKDFEKHIKYLDDQVKAERQARSPSKKFVEDLVNKLVKFKHENEDLKRENTLLKNKVEELTFRLGRYETNVIKTSENKTRNSGRPQKEEGHKVTERQEEEEEKNLQKNISNYLKSKYELRKEVNESKSIFQRFLKKHNEDLPWWNFRKFLQQIDNWTSSIIAIQDKKLDSQKVFSNFSSTFYGMHSSRQPRSENQNKNKPKIKRFRVNLSLKNSKIVDDSDRKQYRHSLK